MGGGKKNEGLDKKGTEETEGRNEERCSFFGWQKEKNGRKGVELLVLVSFGLAEGKDEGDKKAIEKDCPFGFGLEEEKRSSLAHSLFSLCLRRKERVGAEGLHSPFSHMCFPCSLYCFEFRNSHPFPIIHF